MKDTKRNERYLLLVNALGLKMGNIIKVPDWHTYEVREDGFWLKSKRFKESYCEIFDIIVRRGFEIIS